MTTPEWVSEMLQQMAAESTGTAAPIHLQGEPMATAPGHDTVVNSRWMENGTRHVRWASCSCGWSGPLQNVTRMPDGADDHNASAAARKDGNAHAAQFRAPEQPTGLRDTWRYSVTMMDGDELQHLDGYRAKRAEWLQAVHDSGVADKASRAAYKAQREATELYRAAAEHRTALQAAAESLEAELLALVKDGA